MSKPLTPYQRIVRNAMKGYGVVLSCQEVREMSLDDAIATVALNDDEDDEARAALKEKP